MKTLKNIFRLAMVVATAIAVTACDDKQGNGDGLGMTLNSAWTIAYTGAGTIDDTEYDHTVSVLSTDSNTYAITVVYANEYNVQYLPKLGETLVEDMCSYLNSYNSAYDTSYELKDLLYQGTGVAAFDDLDPGRYIAIALGITPEGGVNGLYAVSQAFEIEEETPTVSYSAWIGEWVLEGDNGTSNDITIARKFANRSVNLTGLMGLPFSIVGEYSTDRDDIIFYAQTVAQDYKFSDGSIGSVHLHGLDEDGKFYGLDNGNYGIAIAGVIDGGQRAIVRYGVNQPYYPKFVAMFLVAEVEGEYYNLNGASDTPAFNVMATINARTNATRLNAPMHYLLGKSKIGINPLPLVLGKRIEVASF